MPEDDIPVVDLDENGLPVLPDAPVLEIGTQRNLLRYRRLANEQDAYDMAALRRKAGKLVNELNVLETLGEIATDKNVPASNRVAASGKLMESALGGRHYLIMENNDFARLLMTLCLQELPVDRHEGFIERVQEACAAHFNTGIEL